MTNTIEIISPKVEFIFDKYIPSGENMLKMIEIAGRTCYKSENKITRESAADFIRMLIRKGHESVLEHINYSVKFICDRSTSHQLVRHRIASYSQESQRYINYKKRNSFVFVKPVELTNQTDINIWTNSVHKSVDDYKELVFSSCKPEVARGVLPNSTKTEIVVTMNFRQWRHVFRERVLNFHAQADIKYLMTMVLSHLTKLVPVVFEDLHNELLETKRGEINL